MYGGIALSAPFGPTHSHTSDGRQQVLWCHIPPPPFSRLRCADRAPRGPRPRGGILQSRARVFCGWDGALARVPAGSLRLPAVPARSRKPAASPTAWYSLYLPFLCGREASQCNLPGTRIRPPGAVANGSTTIHHNTLFWSFVLFLSWFSFFFFKPP